MLFLATMPPTTAPVFLLGLFFMPSSFTQTSLDTWILSLAFPKCLAFPWLKISILLFSLLFVCLFLWLSEKVKKKYGKKAGKKIPTYLAMFLLWFSVGLWHGPDWKYVFGVGIFQWVCIVFGELCSPLSKNIRTFKIYPLFCQVRTFLLICFSFLFFRSKGQSALSIYAPWEGIALLLSIGILFYLEIIGQKRDIWQQYLKKPAAIQYCIYYFLIFFIVIFGVYGLGFDSSAFTYANF